MARYRILDGETRGSELVLDARDRLWLEFGGRIDVRAAGAAVRLTDATASVRNEGFVGAGDYGIFSVVGARIFNSGEIRGSIGVQFHGDTGTATFQNTGKVSGNSGVVATTEIDFRNSGYIEAGSGRGVSAAGGSVFNASGAVIKSSSGNYGVLIDCAFGDGLSGETHIVNRGLIEGQAGAIHLIGDRDDRLINHGVLKLGNIGAAIDMGDGDDVVRNTGTIRGDVVLGSGNDVMHNDGVVEAGILYGGAGDDRVRGGSTQTFIVGGAGRDIVSGGEGQDVYLYLSVTDSSGDRTTVDRIRDYDPQNDVIVLKGIDADIGTVGEQAFHLIGDAAFSGAAGELRVGQFRNHLMISGDVDGDGAADMAIIVVGAIDPASLQFLL